MRNVDRIHAALLRLTIASLARARAWARRAVDDPLVALQDALGEAHRRVLARAYRGPFAQLALVALPLLAPI